MQIKKYLFIPTILVSGFLAAQDLKEKLQVDLDPLMEKVIEWRHDIHEFPELGNREFRTSKKVAEQGVDGLILVCAGAGGHAGTLSPFALVREVREFFDGTIILSGSISSGSAVASSLALGADLAYLGTRFIATEEANAEEEYKDMLINSVADDIVYSSLFTGVHGNYLKGSVENAGLDPNNLPEADKSSMNFGSGGNTDAKAWKDIWGSGQGIGSIKDSPSVQTLVDQLTIEFKEAVEDLNQKSTY